MLHALDLFSGIGGITYALQDFVRPVAYCEIEPYCQSVLLSRMQEGHLPKAPIWDDIRTFQGSFWRCDVDIIYGGFPCQDISIAGRGAGLEGERSGLFFEILRLAKEIKPKFLFLENVPAITSRGGLRVVREIASLGYDCRWSVISAASVGAMHKRERWFLLANTSIQSANRHPFRKEETHSMPGNSCENVSQSDSTRLQAKRTEQSTAGTSGGCTQNDCISDCISGKQADSKTIALKDERNTWRRSSRFYRPFESRDEWKKTVSKMGKCSDGLPYQVDRLKSLGNAVVPQQVRKAFLTLLGFSN
jgi:DNA (cytosine-5)-methyltransferase 1